MRGAYRSTRSLFRTFSGEGGSSSSSQKPVHSTSADDRTSGLSPDFTVVNPIGFLALTIWNWGVYFSPVARTEYQNRHHGHQPQISKSDLAFSLHALIASTATLLQVVYYWRKNKNVQEDPADEERRLLLKDSSRFGLSTSTLRPSFPISILVAVLVIAAFISAAFVWAGKQEFLDWLYFVSTIKLIISLVKYLPQILLNYRLKQVSGYANGVVNLVSRISSAHHSFRVGLNAHTRI